VLVAGLGREMMEARDSSRIAHGMPKLSKQASLAVASPRLSIFSLK